MRIFFCCHNHSPVSSVQSGLITCFDDVGVRSIMIGNISSAGFHPPGVCTRIASPGLIDGNGRGFFEVSSMTAGTTKLVIGLAYE